MARVRDRRSVGSVALRGLLTAVFLVAAVMKFAAVPFEVEGFVRFGYPLWFMDVVGALQLLGAVLLWTPGCVALGAGLLAVLMAGAVGSHLENLERNDGFKGFNQTGVTEIIKETDPRLLKV